MKIPKEFFRFSFGREAAWMCAVMLASVAILFFLTLLVSAILQMTR
jgi:hypothetical protein